MKVADLKAELKSRGLKQDGNKADLVQRLEEHDEARYMSMKKVDLQAEAKKRGLKQSGNKRDLATCLRQNPAPEPSVDETTPTSARVALQEDSERGRSERTETVERVQLQAQEHQNRAPPTLLSILTSSGPSGPVQRGILSYLRDEDANNLRRAMPQLYQPHLMLRNPVHLGMELSCQETMYHNNDKVYVRRRLGNKAFPPVVRRYPCTYSLDVIPTRRSPRLLERHRDQLRGGLLQRCTGASLGASPDHDQDFFICQPCRIN